MNLKTLKEMEDYPEEYLPHQKVASVEDLKQEAARWVKELRRTLCTDMVELSGVTINNKLYTYQDALCLNMWIINFFNLTLEDIK